MKTLSVHFRVLAFTCVGVASMLAACADEGGGGGAGTGVAPGIGGTGVAGISAAGTGVAGTGVAGMDVAGTGAAGMGETGATFSRIYEEIIVGTGCNGGGLCHGGLVGMLTMNDKQSSYDALVNVPAMGTNLTGMPPHCADSGTIRVVPGNPAASLLMQKLEDTQTCGDPMPPGISRLPAEQIELFRMWIAAGAMND
jgi:hypothetical protein